MTYFSEGIPLWQTALILGLTAGLCEELARAAGFALLRRFRRFEDGGMMALGHGGIEAMVFGGVLTAATVSALLSLQSVDLDTLNLSSEQVTAVSWQLELFSLSAWLAVTPLLERLIAMLAHLVLSLLVWQTFNRRHAGYLLAAVGYHAAIDAVAVYLANQVQSPWLTLVVFMISVTPGLIWLTRVWPRPAERPQVQASSLTREGAIFLTALRKELYQTWRTKRLLVVLAVFAIMGLFSPLAAKFTPELLRNIEGAEQFADLIPEPTMADAMTQYIKNVTQFGFILAVLLGMGAVVGEKEKGTAAMIMSKPMSRWAFVLSKFLAQTLLYAAGFVIAAFGTAYYTWILFGPIDAAAFFVTNLLLLLWLLTFAAVALLGSTLASSTGAAAGIGLGGAVLLLLAGNIPGVGSLAPGGLVAWASQLSLGDGGGAVGINGGAVAMGAVIILLCLMAAVAAFESQEI
jgi:ABC-2 type transport system permease protein